MPPAEIEIDVDLVESLLAEQRPDLAGLEVVPLATGWDNVSFRVGDGLVARLPRRQLAAQLVENEVRWLPELAPRLPLPVPAPVFVGRPGAGYPWSWSIVPLLSGRPFAHRRDLDEEHAPGALARFLVALHRPAPAEAPWNPYRSIPLQQRHDSTMERILALGDRIDARRAIRRWEAALDSPPFAGDPSWIHGDLHPKNLLVAAGRISAVIDFGDIASGDPATDLAIAWMVFPADTRPGFARSYANADQGTWDRAAGWALSLATAHLAFSADNPEMGEIGRTTIEWLLDDPTPASPVSE